MVFATKNVCQHSQAMRVRDGAYMSVCVVRRLGWLRLSIVWKRIRRER